MIRGDKITEMEKKDTRLSIPPCVVVLAAMELELVVFGPKEV